MKIKNKQTGEIFEILGFVSGNAFATGGLFTKAGTECCVADFVMAFSAY